MVLGFLFKTQIVMLSNRCIKLFTPLTIVTRTAVKAARSHLKPFFVAIKQINRAHSTTHMLRAINQSQQNTRLLKTNIKNAHIMTYERKSLLSLKLFKTSNVLKVNTAAKNKWLPIPPSPTKGTEDYHKNEWKGSCGGRLSS